MLYLFEAESAADGQIAACRTRQRQRMDMTQICPMVDGKLAICRTRRPIRPMLVHDVRRWTSGLTARSHSAPLMSTSRSEDLHQSDAFTHIRVRPFRSYRRLIPATKEFES
jgi:hypothetical protein